MAEIWGSLNAMMGILRMGTDVQASAQWKRIFSVEVEIAPILTNAMKAYLLICSLSNIHPIIQLFYILVNLSNSMVLT